MKSDFKIGSRGGLAYDATHQREVRYMAKLPKAEVHKLLARQLRRHVDQQDPFSGTWSTFLEAVNDAYHQHDMDREMLERALELSSQELLQANSEMRTLIHELEAKNLEMESFANAVTHDLKGPLFTIEGFLGLLKQDALAGDVERLETDLQRIRLATQQMRKLLDELLSLSRVGQVASEPEEVSLRDLALQAASLVAGRIAEAGARVDVSAELPTVTADRPRLLEVFQNLIDNAVKFMGSQSQPAVEIFARHGKAETVYCVRDNGAGIDPIHHEKVFRLFDRLQAGKEGSGVGLALVKRIVEHHGGRIWVESAGAGRGSTFCFTLAESTSPNPVRS